jgi:hypothetical protein
MNEKYQKIVELVEINRKTIDEMFGTKSVNLHLAQDCILEIRSLLQELFDNSQYVALAAATRNFSKTTSLHGWPQKKKFTEAHRELMALSMPTFGVSILDLNMVFTDDSAFNAECLERSHFELATFFERGLSLSESMKKLLINHQFETLDLLIEKSKDCYTLAHDLRHTSLFSLIDCVIKNPKDELVENYFINNILPMITRNRLRIYKGKCHDYTANEYIDKLVKFDKIELAKKAFDLIDYDEHDPIDYFKMAERLGVNEIKSAVAHNIVLQAMNSIIKSNELKTEIFTQVIRLASIESFYQFKKVDFFNWSISPEILDNICSRLISREKSIKKKLGRIVPLLIRREIELSQKGGIVARDQKIKCLRDYANLAKFMEKMPELQRHRLESDLSM